MSRPKSNRTLLIEQERAVRKEERERKKAEKERDRAIRKERREQKRKEREARRAIRLRKKATHESVAKNGIPKVKSEVSHFGLREAIAYSPCDGCHRIVGNTEIVSRFCGTCEYGAKKEVVDSPECLKAQQGDVEGELGLLPFQDNEGGEI